MEAREIMTEHPACCTPGDTVEQAARMMIERDCGCIPVVEDTRTKRIVGVVTDRDLACRCLGQGKGADTQVREVMSVDPSCCTPEADLQEVESIMTARQVRRIPVVDAQGCCVGVIAQADLARAKQAVGNREVGRVVEHVSTPTDTPRAETGAGVRPGQERG